MPQVPSYDNPQVALNGAQSVRVDAPEYQDASSKQLQQLGHGMQQAGGAVGQIADKMTEEVNKTQLTKMYDSYVGAQRWLEQSPEEGYVHLKGEQAMPSPDKPPLEVVYGDKLNKARDSILKTAGNNFQREQFISFAAQADQQFMHGIARHVSQEFETHRVTVQANGIALGQKVIVQALTPEDAARGEARIKEGVNALVAQKFINPESADYKNELQVQYQNTLGPAYTTRIASMIDNGNTTAAALLLGEKKDYIDATSYEKLTHALHTGTRLEKAQAFGDEVIASKMSETEALTEARKRFTGEEEELATRHIKDIFAAKNHADALDAKAASTASWGKVMETGRMPPPSMLADLRVKAPEEERQMRDWLEAKQRRDANEGAPTDWQKYYSLRRMATDDPATFTSLDLMKSKPYLHNGEFNRLVELQAGISKADAKAMQSQVMVKNAITLVKGELANVGIDLTPKEGSPQAAETAKFLSALTIQLDSAAKAKGSPLTEDETRRLSMGLLKEGIEQGSGIFGFMQSKKRGYQIATDPNNKANYVESNFFDIPVSVRNKIIASEGFKTDPYNGAVSDSDKAEIERIYTRGKQQGRF